MALPLRIFEERYKTMVRELISSGGEFGVLLIREGEEVGGTAIPFSVGVMARIEEWTEIDAGRFALSARGTRRFRLVEMLTPRPFPFGEVEFIDDDNPVPDDKLRLAIETVRTVFPAYFRLALSLTDQWARGMELPTEPHALVNFLGPWLQAPEQTKQRLLEAIPAFERVVELAAILEELLTQARDEVTEYRRSKYFGMGSQN
jgi:Lon protease-like protein